MNKLKKFLATGILGLGILVGVASPAFADEAGWQNVGADTFQFNAGSYNDILQFKKYTGDYRTFNNNLKLYVPKITGTGIYKPKLYISLYEYDPNSADELIASGYFPSYDGVLGDVDVTYDITKFEDGDNHLAEVYAVYEYNFSTSTSKVFNWYD